MRREFSIEDGDIVETPYEQDEIDAKAARQIENDAEKIETDRAKKYVESEDELQRRSLLILGIRGRRQFLNVGKELVRRTKEIRGTATQAEIDETDAQDAKMNQIDVLEDRCNTIQDAIEAASTQAGIDAPACDPFLDANWS